MFGFIFRGGPSSKDQQVRIDDLIVEVRQGKAALRDELAKMMTLLNVLVTLRESWPSIVQVRTALKHEDSQEASDLRQWLMAKLEFVADALQHNQIQSAADLFIRLNLSTGYQKIIPILENCNKQRQPVPISALHNYMVAYGEDEFRA